MLNIMFLIVFIFKNSIIIKIDRGVEFRFRLLNSTRILEFNVKIRLEYSNLILKLDSNRQRIKNNVIIFIIFNNVKK